MQQKTDKDPPLAGAEVSVSEFHTFGFAVLRQFFDPIGLIEEIDRVLRDGILQTTGIRGGVATSFQYVPMMTAETPFSLSLLDRTEALAKIVLGGPVLPTRAKAVRYCGDTSWHTDSVLPIASVGVAAYLEDLDTENGALRVLPGSHRPEFSEAIRGLGEDLAIKTLPAHTVATRPGDVIMFDEHLFHASCGGEVRRQWRVDFVKDPITEEEEGLARSYFAGIFASNWDGGYEVERYPNYGVDWQHSGRESVVRLRNLGVYELVNRQEEFMRSLRRA